MLYSYTPPRAFRSRIAADAALLAAMFLLQKVLLRYRPVLAIAFSVLALAAVMLLAPRRIQYTYSIEHGDTEGRYDFLVRSATRAPSAADVRKGRGAMGGIRTECRVRAAGRITAAPSKAASRGLHNYCPASARADACCFYPEGNLTAADDTAPSPGTGLAILFAPDFEMLRIFRQCGVEIETSVWENARRKETKNTGTPGE